MAQTNPPLFGASVVDRTDPFGPSRLPFNSSESAFSGITYDGSGRLSGYVTTGTVHSVSYPDSTHIVDVGGGVTTVYTLDGSGRFLSKVVN